MESARPVTHSDTHGLTSQKEDDLRDLEEDSHVAPSHVDVRRLSPTSALLRPCSTWCGDVCKKRYIMQELVIFLLISFYSSFAKYRFCRLNKFMSNFEDTIFNPSPF